jgi:hypothetical protein
LDLFDVVNGLFELLGGVVLSSNVKKIRVDKMIRGVNWRVTGFFTAWGFFNTAYYPHLGQWFSFSGGLVIVVVNCVWLYYAVKYRNA